MPETENTEVTNVVTESPNTPVPQDNDFESKLEKAREQERNKLYSKIQKEEVRAKQAEEKLSLLEANLEELNKFKEAAELEKLGEKEKLERQILQLQNKVQEAAKESARKESVLQEKLRLFELSEYRMKRVREVNLDPDFEDFVMGTSENEIDASLVKAQEREARFKEKYTNVPVNNNIRSSPSSNPALMPNPGPKVVDIDDITDIKEFEQAKRQFLRERGLLR